MRPVYRIEVYANSFSILILRELCNDLNSTLFVYRYGKYANCVSKW